MPPREPVVWTIWLGARAEESLTESTEATLAQSLVAAWANWIASTVSSEDTVEKSHSSDQPPPQPQAMFCIHHAGYSSCGGKVNAEFATPASMSCSETSATSSQDSGGASMPASS